MNTGRSRRSVKKKPPIPYSRKPDHLSFEEWQIGLRNQFALTQKFKIKNIGDHPVYSDFEVANRENDRSYRVALRSRNIGFNFCNCPDFRLNSLGTCKHVEGVLHLLQKNRKYRKLLETEYVRPYSSITLRYGAERRVILRIGAAGGSKIKALAAPFFDRNMILKEDAIERFEEFLEKARRIDPQFRCYPDALNFVISEREKRKRIAHIDKKYSEGKESKTLDSIVKTSLYPYQKEAVLAAVKAGRYLIADDMGLGKTIQAVAVAELMKKELGIESVLIVCPTSLKYQWKTEIEKFTSRGAQVVEGLRPQRDTQYRAGGFYKIASYNSATRDIDLIHRCHYDLIVLDEAQRIKNWKTQTAQTIKRLESPYALVLTGTPLENRLEELHSLVEFVDPYKLGLLARFLYRHQVTDAGGKVTGYKNLNQIGESISSICIRRTKKEVLKELPERIDKTIMVDVTPEQMEIHNEHYETVSRLVRKWRRSGFLSESDRQRLMISLNSMRMVSNSTYILDQESRHDTKIGELMGILDDLFASGGEKIVIFSQWERMTRLISQELDRRSVAYQNLHGGVPSAKRKELLNRFRTDPECRVFLSTDAGGVGLNLQHASYLFNMDCPWNPAVLEQRIGRVHRLGQERPVTITYFISKGTIEERMLSLLQFKKDLFKGVLDGGEDQVFMGESRMNRFMKSVEELTRDPQPPPALAEEGEVEPPRETLMAGEPSEEYAKNPSRGTRLPGGKDSIGDLLETGMSFLGKIGNIFSEPGSANRLINSWIEKDSSTGKTYLKIPVEKEESLRKAANALGNLLQSFVK